MSSSLDNIDLLNHRQTQESANTIDIPSLVQSVPDNRTSCDCRKTDVDARLKMIEIKKERVKALTAFAKTQTIVAEIDIAIAEYELKCELYKLQKLKDNNTRRSKNIHSSQRTSEKTKTSKINNLGCEQRTSPKNKVSHQNMKPHNQDLMLEDASLQPKAGKYCSDEKNFENKLKIKSIMCSIPLDKIIHLQNVSTVGKHIISTYLLQEQKTNKLNTESYTRSIANCTEDDQFFSDQNAYMCNEDIPIGLPTQEDRNDIKTNSFVSTEDESLQPKKRICMSMLKVSHSYNFCIIPNFMTQNESGFACVEGDEVSMHKQKTERN